MNHISVTDTPRKLGDITPEQREKQIERVLAEKKKAEDREKQSSYKHWVQYNNDYTKEMMNLTIKYPKAMAILFFLVDQMDNYNAVVCSMTVITEVIGCSRQTASTAIKQLKDLGFIAVYKSGTGNVYTINDKVYWKSWGSNHKYCKFPANVVLAQSEQYGIDNEKFNSSRLKVIEAMKNVDVGSLLPDVTIPDLSADDIVDE